MNLRTHQITTYWRGKKKPPPPDIMNARSDGDGRKEDQITLPKKAKITTDEHATLASEGIRNKRVSLLGSAATGGAAIKRIGTEKTLARRVDKRFPPQRQQKTPNQAQDATRAHPAMTDRAETLGHDKYRWSESTPSTTSSTLQTGVG